MVNFYYLSFLFCSISLYMLGLLFLNLEKEVFIEFNVLSLNSVSIEMVIFLDWISLLFMSFVFFISSMVVMYSEEYMVGDKFLSRFYYLVILFVVSMMLMILSPNLISILLGWDGLGLISYCLVIYYQNVKSYNAGMLTALSNRVGDAALLVSIALMMHFGSWNFQNYLEFWKYESNMAIISIFIVLASITKSAQIPFSSWLPAAMAAPTPVSSLVHSSTLVTAGVYLLIRFNQVFSENMLFILLYLSLFTMFMAGVAANFEFDLKKIIALSTLSQLGMMIVILSLGGSDLAFFHLLIHALFKALLFMCAGAMIHNLLNIQDIRCMGGIIHSMPLTCMCFNVSNFALCGLPFMSGFYSKDLVAEALSMEYLSVLVYVVFFISIGLTVAYSIRLTFYIFIGDSNIFSLNFFNDNNNKVMLNGMMNLVLLVIFMGSILSWLMFPIPYFIVLPAFMKILTLIMILIGAFLGYELFLMNYLYNNKSLACIDISMFAVSMWNLPILSTYGLNSYFLRLGKIYSKSFDQGWHEYYGSKNLFKLMKDQVSASQLLSHNHLKIFLLIMMIFFLIFICFLN
uniref:NADH-ubiquinone oxidoreductase chain 5 n=1 Tax=Lepyrus sp. G312 TaxID=2480751 RepID=A0A3G2JZD0_9CUCU|nr:NADH dehydrogenase subunit 5 [Lepyrus sp. G312]